MIPDVLKSNYEGVMGNGWVKTDNPWNSLDVDLVFALFNSDFYTFYLFLCVTAALFKLCPAFKSLVWHVCHCFRAVCVQHSLSKFIQRWQERLPVSQKTYARSNVCCRAGRYSLCAQICSWNRTTYHWTLRLCRAAHHSVQTSWLTATQRLLCSLLSELQFLQWSHVPTTHSLHQHVFVLLRIFRSKKKSVFTMNNFILLGQESSLHTSYTPRLTTEWWKM